jgi:hypothetical protein
MAVPQGFPYALEISRQGYNAFVLALPRRPG